MERQIIKGARYVGEELRQIDISMRQEETVTEVLQEALKKVSGRMNGQDSRQAQHEQVILYLHQTRQSEGSAGMSRDQQLGQEPLDMRAQHRRERQNHKRRINPMLTELEGNKEVREGQESHIAELTEVVTSMMSQVRGKRSTPTLEPSAGADEGGGGRPHPTMHGAVGGTPDPGDSDGEESRNKRTARHDARPVRRNEKPARKENLIGKTTEKLGRMGYCSPGH